MIKDFPFRLKPFDFNPDWSEPMEESAFYKWLESNATDYPIEDKVGYLKTLGFVHGKDKVDDRALQYLWTISHYYYQIKYPKSVTVIE